MATNQPGRGGAAESMAEFVRRRNREQAQRGLTRAAAHHDYGQAIRANRDLDLGHPSAGMGHGGSHNRDLAAPDPEVDLPNFADVLPTTVTHPGFAESFIPVWGSGREAIADFQDHDYPAAALNAALAALDLSLAGGLRKAVAKGGIYAVRGAIGKSASEAGWKHSVRPTMVDLGLLDGSQEGHHWLIPQRWKAVPPQITNHPFNIHGVKREVHRRVHTRYLGQPKFGLLERYWRGSPHWSKAATASAVGHPVAAAEARAKRR